MHSAQLRFSLPWGQGVHSTHLLFCFPCEHRFCPIASRVRYRVRFHVRPRAAIASTQLFATRVLVASEASVGARHESAGARSGVRLDRVRFKCTRKSRLRQLQCVVFKAVLRHGVARPRVSGPGLGPFLARLDVTRPDQSLRRETTGVCVCLIEEVRPAMADKGNHVLVAVLSALAGAKLQDICVAMLSRRRERKNGPRVVKQTPTSTPTRTPTKPKPSDGVIPETGTPVRVAASSRIDSKKEHVVCPTCDSPDAYATGKHVVSLHNTATVKKPDPYDPAGRETYLSWDDYFMSVAFLSAQRSKDPNKQVGAVIVSPSKIICGVGYNGFPRGCVDESLPWAKKDKENNPMRTKYPYVCHAEMNAIMNKNSENLVGASLFVTMYPCVECAKLILQVRVCMSKQSESWALFPNQHVNTTTRLIARTTPSPVYVIPRSTKFPIPDTRVTLPGALCGVDTVVLN